MSKKITVTSANSLSGQMLLPRLQEQGHHVTALVRKGAKLPAQKIIPDWTNSSEAKQALETSDTIIHLSGEVQAKNWQGYYEPNVRTTEIVAEALRKGRAKRVVFISYPNVDVNSSNLFLKAKGQAEQLLLTSGKETIIFRVQAIINTPQEPGPTEEAIIVKAGKKARALGNGQQKMFTIYRPDVVKAIIKAVEIGSPGIYDLTGPDQLTMDGLIRLLNRNPQVGISHTPEWLARVLSRFIPDLPRNFVDLYFREYDMDGSKTDREFGLEPTSLRTIWK